MPLINKKILDHCAHLSRLKLTEAESKKFLKDLGAILRYFKQLQEVDTDGIQPMMGAAALQNVVREDTVNIDRRAYTADEPGRIIAAFPESPGGRLKVPKIL